MNRKKFVPQVAAIFMPHVEWSVDKAIAYAEALHRRLMERGYGTDPQQPRDAKDWYGELPKHQQGAFDQFWLAYNHKAGKQRAAMRWGQLAPNDEQARLMIDAAKADAQTQRPKDQVRKMPEGWLSERRWEDYTPPQTPVQDLEKQRLRTLQGDLNHLRKLHAARPSDDLEAQIKALEEALHTKESSHA